MNDVRFACPHCSQHLACAVGYVGHHIQCPGCNSPVIVPQALPSVGLPISPVQSNTVTIGANDIRFGCLSCGQRLACGMGYAGHHIQCPGCHRPLVVPSTLKIVERPPTASLLPSSYPVPPGPRATPPRTLTPIDDLRNVGILAVSAMASSWLFNSIISRLFHNSWPTIRDLESLGFSLYLLGGIGAFALGVSYISQHSKSIVAQIVGGVLAVSMSASSFSFIFGAGCAGCSLFLAPGQPDGQAVGRAVTLCLWWFCASAFLFVLLYSRILAHEQNRR